MVSLYIINRLHYLLIWRQIGCNLWYLSEELVGLALFDPRVSLEKKRLMLATMEDPSPDHPPKRPEVNSAAFLSTLGLGQFCTKNTKRLFFTLGRSQAFLAMDPSEWGRVVNATLKK